MSRYKCFSVVSIHRQERADGKGSSLFYTLPDGREVGFNDLPVGAMFHTDQIPPLSDGYKMYQDDQASLCVVLPGKNIWHMHHKGTDGCSWQVTGTAPDVTAFPSINFVGRYHGWVQNGFVTDDVDGRKFDDAGKLIQ